jgi:hypothetical protein
LEASFTGGYLALRRAALIQHNRDPTCSSDHEWEQIQEEESRCIHGLSPPSARLANKCNRTAPKSQAVVEITIATDIVDWPDDRADAGAIKPAATQAVDKRSMEFASNLVRSL